MIALLVSTLGTAAFFVAAGAVVVFVVGALTLALYRSGLLRLAALRAAAVTLPVRAVLADIALAALTTCCGCASHAVLHVFRAHERRALRVLALTSSLRLVPFAAAAGCAFRDGSLWPLWHAMFAVLFFSIVVDRRAPTPGTLAPAALFVQRSSTKRAGDAVSDSWDETREMLRRYWLHLALPAALAAVMLIKAPIVPGGVVVALALPLLARVVRVDAIALAPLVVVLVMSDVSASVLVQAVVVADAAAVRTRRVVDDYLTIRGREAWSTALTQLALACAFVGFIGALFER